MIKGLYISATSLIQNRYKLEVISNNLANLETTGYKKDEIDLSSFNARLQRRINGTNYPFENGKIEVNVTQDGHEYTLSTNYGYFKVQTPDGVHHAKEVRVMRDRDGYLRTVYRGLKGDKDHTRGEYLLSENKPIKIEGDLQITKDGIISSVDGDSRVVYKVHPNVIGTMSAGVKGYNVRPSFEQGNIVHTGVTTDFALKGEGFFTVIAPNGEEYLTRNGAFTINQSSELTLLDGSKLKGLNGPIKVEGEFGINDYGEIIQHGEIIDRMEVVRYTKPEDLAKVGATFFKQREGLMGEKIPFDGEIIQSSIERSNTDPITEMIKMIELNRAYESSQKVVNTIEDMLSKAVTEVGKV